MILLLLYNLLTVAVLFFRPADISTRIVAGIYGLGVCVFPIAGCLADLCYGRYKLIKISMWLIWVFVVLQAAISVVFYAMGVLDGSSLSKWVTIALMIPLALGLAGFLSNIIQFGMDQLRDAPTTEITSFIVWYAWTWNFGMIFGIIWSSCLCGAYKLVTTLVFPTSVGLALCLDGVFNHWLVKEPVCTNPFRLFFGVLRYAVKNKYPRQRSAFTYWEDKPYSRIDLAKDKYGGPFTTEQVEDVKIVLRILAILTIACSGMGMSFAVACNTNKVFNDLSGTERRNSSQHCSNETMQSCILLLSMKYIRFLVFLVFIPVHEIVIYPAFRNYVTKMTSFIKFIFGLFLLVLHYISLLIIEAVGYTDIPNKDSTCFLKEKDNKSWLNFKWYSIPEVLRGLSLLYVAWGCMEFICSQAPYSMKGVLLGFGYFLLGSFYLLSVLLLLPVSLTVENWHPVPYGCGVWFYLCVTVIFLVFTLVCIIVSKKVYKMRRRDEDLHNRHIFAINYYSHYVQYNKEMETDHQEE